MNERTNAGLTAQPRPATKAKTRLQRPVLLHSVQPHRAAAAKISDIVPCERRITRFTIAHIRGRRRLERRFSSSTLTSTAANRPAAAGGERLSTQRTRSTPSGGRALRFLIGERRKGKRNARGCCKGDYQ